MCELKTSASPNERRLPIPAKRGGLAAGKRRQRDSRPVRGSIWGMAFVRKPFTRGVGSKTGLMDPQTRSEDDACDMPRVWSEGELEAWDESRERAVNG